MKRTGMFWDNHDIKYFRINPELLFLSIKDGKSKIYMRVTSPQAMKVELTGTMNAVKAQAIIDQYKSDFAKNEKRGIVSEKTHYILRVFKDGVFQGNFHDDCYPFSTGDPSLLKKDYAKHLKDRIESDGIYTCKVIKWHITETEI